MLPSQGSCLLPTDLTLRDENHAVFPIVTQGLIDRRPWIIFDEWMYEWSNAKYLGVNKFWVTRTLEWPVDSYVDPKSWFLILYSFWLVLLPEMLSPRDLWQPCSPASWWGSWAAPTGPLSWSEAWPLSPTVSLGVLAAYRLTTPHFLPNIRSSLDFPSHALSQSLDFLMPAISGMKWGWKGGNRRVSLLFLTSTSFETRRLKNLDLMAPTSGISWRYHPQVLAGLSCLGNTLIEFSDSWGTVLVFDIDVKLHL